MKKTFTLFTISTLLLIGASAFVSDTKYNTGIAGYTGAPGEQTCAACHSGGTSLSSHIFINSIPKFNNFEYFPDSVYTISISTYASSTNVIKYGFGCEILDNLNDNNAGTLQNPGSGVKIINAPIAGRKNAVHTTGKIAVNDSATFTFKWKAPPAGSGALNIYATGNAVNDNGNTNGDLVLQNALTISEGTVAVVQPTFTAIQETMDKFISNVIVSPNPSSGFSQISYSLKNESMTEIELFDISGKKIKQLVKENEQPGYQSHIINVSSVPLGVYFVRVISNGNQVSQKLVSVN